MNVFSQLRQKRIVQILLSYLAVGWVLLEVTDQLSSRGVLPNTAYTIALVWVASGVIGALMIGWNHGEKGKQKAPKSEILVLVLLGVFALAGSGFVVQKDVASARMAAAAEHPLELRNIAVMYLEDHTDSPDLAYLADGLTEDLISSLSKVRELDVRSKNATLQFRGSEPPLDSVGKVLGVGTVVAGSVEKRGDKIEVNLQLVDGASGAVVKRSKLSRPANEILAMRDGVVQEAANLLRSWMGQEIRLRQSERGTKVREAWALVQRAERAHKEAEAAVKSAGPAAGEAQFQQADAFLVQAQKLDPFWAEPAIQRATLIFRRAKLAIGAGAPDQAVALIDSGLNEAEHGLMLAPNEARALEMRGSLKYFKWLLNVTPDEKERQKLLDAARTDLQAAVELDGSLASAHATLGHLLGNVEGLDASLIEQRRAYEEDAYLESADMVLWRLFYGNFDRNNLIQANDWCTKGADRFPADYRFAFCQLLLMTSPIVKKPDVAKAWALHNLVDSLAPAPRKQYEQVHADLAVGGVLARAGLADSARAVLARAHDKLTPELDPAYDMYVMEGAMRLLLGDRQGAFNVVRRAIAGNPQHAFTEDVTWYLRDLENYPRVKELYSQSN